MKELKLIPTFAFSAVASILLSFFLFDNETLSVLISVLGLPVLAIVFGCWMYLSYRALNGNCTNTFCEIKRPSAVRVQDVFFIALLTSMVHLSQPHEFKVVMDEVNSINASRAIFEYQQIFAPGSLDFTYDDFRLSAQGYVDKRPFLFPFAVSILHFLTGYRYTNGFLLNLLLTPVLLTSMLVIVRCYVTRPLVGYLGVLLFVSFPFVSRVMTSSGAELLNATLLALLVLVSIFFYNRPSKEGANLMFATACMLAYARYESIAYVLAVGTIWCLVCLRERKLLMSPITCLFPLFLIPLIWIQRIVQSKSSEYFQHEMLGKERTFSVEYLGGNIEHLFAFLFHPQSLSLNAPLTVSILVIVLLVVLLRSGGIGPVRHRDALLKILRGPLIWIGLMAVGLQGLLLFYLWGDMNDPMVTRIGMPFILMWVLIATVLWGVEFSDRVKPGPILIAAALCLWFGFFAKSDGLVEDTNLPVKFVNTAGEWVRQEVDWRDVVYAPNVAMFLPYRVRVFPESNLAGSFHLVYQLQDNQVINRVYLMDAIHPLHTPVDLSRRYPEFLRQGGEFELVRHMNIGPGYELALYKLDFTDYKEDHN